MSDKLHEFDKEREEQKKVIEELRGGVSSLNKKVYCITEQRDQQEHYSRRNCFLINVITEGNQENADVLTLEIFKETLDVELTQRDLDQTHQIDKNDKSKN